MNEACRGFVRVPAAADADPISEDWAQALAHQTVVQAAVADPTGGLWELSLSDPGAKGPQGMPGTLVETLLWSLLARPDFDVVLQPLSRDLCTEAPPGVTDQYTPEQLRRVLEGGWLALWRPAEDGAARGGVAEDPPAELEQRLLEAGRSSPRRLLVWNRALAADAQPPPGDEAGGKAQVQPSEPRRPGVLVRAAYGLRGWAMHQARERLPLGLKVRIKRLLRRPVEGPLGDGTPPAPAAAPQDLPLARLRSWEPPFPRPEVNLDLPPRAPGRIPVLVAIHWLELGGAEKFAVDLIRALPKDEYAVYVTTDVPSENTWTGAVAEHVEEMLHLPAFLTPSLFGVFYEYYIRTRGIRLLHIHHGPRAYESLFHIRRFHPRLKVLDSLHILELPPHSGGYPEFACANFEVFIDRHHVISEYLREFLLQRWLVPAEKVQLTYLNVDTRRFDPTLVEQGSLRRAHDIPPSACVVGFIGRMVYQKQPLEFVDAAYRLTRRWQDAGMEQPLHFLMVGSGPLQREVEMAIRAKGLERVVHLHGEVDDTRPAYRDCDLLLMPSINEGLALVAYEAMAMEVPILFTDVGAQRELLPAEFLVPPDGPVAEDLARVAWPLLLDAKRRRRVGKEMRRLVVREHRVEQTMEQMLALYRSLLQVEDA